MLNFFNALFQRTTKQQPEQFNRYETLLIPAKFAEDVRRLAKENNTTPTLIYRQVLRAGLSAVTALSQGDTIIIKQADGTETPVTGKDE